MPPLELDLMPPEERPPEPQPPKTLVIRYGFLREIGEFASDLTQRVCCGTKLIIRTDRGTEIAELLTTTCENDTCAKGITREKFLAYIAASGGREYPFSQEGRVLRPATPQDQLEQSKLDENHHKHLTMAKELVQTHRLSMKIVDVEHVLGGERILFYFVSEHRVDFRSLVRDLAHLLHTRIEMRQVGARDEARLTADFEKCGNHCCCRQFLKVLTPISMRAAKVQKATLDPTKISGRCGRLMCCLRYEDQTYEMLRKKLPKRNTRVTTEKGDAWVIDGQILTQLVMCQYDDGKREPVPLEKITAFDRPKPVIDGRTMQTPNDRPPPPPMLQGDMPGRRGPGAPANGTPPLGGPPMRRPQPATPITPAPAANTDPRAAGADDNLPPLVPLVPPVPVIDDPDDSNVDDPWALPAPRPTAPEGMGGETVAGGVPTGTPAPGATDGMPPRMPPAQGQPPLPGPSRQNQGQRFPQNQQRGGGGGGRGPQQGQRPPQPPQKGQRGPQNQQRGRGPQQPQQRNQPFRPPQPQQPPRRSGPLPPKPQGPGQPSPQGAPSPAAPMPPNVLPPSAEQRPAAPPPAPVTSPAPPPPPANIADAPPAT